MIQLYCNDWNSTMVQLLHAMIGMKFNKSRRFNLALDNFDREQDVEDLAGSDVLASCNLSSPGYD